MVGDIAEQPATEGTHQKGSGEQHGCVELLHHRIAVGEEGRRKIQRERGIGIEVVPFDEIANGADEDGLDPALDVVNVEAVVRAHPRCLVSHVGSPKKL